MGTKFSFKKYLYLLFISLILVITAACSGEKVIVPVTPHPAVTSTPAESPTPTVTSTPTGTPTPTATDTPTPTPRYNVTEFESTTYVSLDSLNVRQGPDTKYGIIGKLYKGDRVTATGQTPDGWIRIDYEGVEAYVSGQYVMTEEEYVKAYPTPTPDPKDSLDQTITQYADFTGGAFAIIDVMTGEILYSENGDTQMYPASLTKMMTGLLACECLDFNQVIAYPEAAGRWQYETSFIADGLVTDVVKGNFSGILKEYGLDNTMTTLSDAHSKYADGSYLVPFGTEYTVDEMVHTLMMISAADVADALAWTIGEGSFQAFYDMMNERAAQLGMTNSYFDNPVGADDLGTIGLEYKTQNLYYESFGKIRTTANDLARLARACMRNEHMREVVSTAKYTLTGRNGLADLTFSNSVLPVSQPETYSSAYFTAVGIKTGCTDLAGNCLALAGRNSKGKELVVIYLKNMDSTNSRKNTAKQSVRLLEYAFRKLAEQ